MKLSEGQKLWWVPQHSLGMKGREVTVLKVGRKWAELDNGERIDLETLISDGGRYAPNGRCYLSQEAYEQAEALVQAWIKLKRDLQYGRIPEDVTIGDIELARLLLGMTSNAKLPKERLNKKENEMIEIEKNVPMPEGRGLSGRFPFGDMKVGDSFAVDVPPDTLAVHVGSFAARIRNTANHCAKKGGMKFSTLLVEGKKRVRVWRTK